MARVAGAGGGLPCCASGGECVWAGAVHAAAKELEREQRQDRRSSQTARASSVWADAVLAVCAQHVLWESANGLAIHAMEAYA